MRRPSILIALGTVLCCAAPGVHALGFAGVANATTLGQPLDFAANLLLDGDEHLARECVSASVFAGEHRIPGEQVRATLEPGRDARQRSVRVTTRTPISEPVVTVNVTVGCGSQLSRQFVAFIDPPQGQLAAALPPQRLDTQVAPLLAIVEPRAATPLHAAPAEKPMVAPRAERADEHAAPIAPRARPAKRVLAGTDGTKAAASSDTPKPRRVAQKAVRGPRGPRLRLDVTEPVRRTAATPAIAPEAGAAALAAAAAASQAAAETAKFSALLAQERERIGTLEAGIQQLRNDAQAMRQSVAALQAQLQQAEAARYTNPLVLVLAALSLLLAVVAALGWRRPRASRWWDAEPAATAPAAPHAVSPARDAAAVEPVMEPESAPDDEPWTYRRPAVTQPAEIGGLEVTTVLEVLPQRVAPEAKGGSAASALDELIDLEQQREFFVVLGQDAAALELLAEHLRGRQDASPLPYLETLELQRRLGQRDAHAATRASFAERFGVEAPGWDDGPGTSLEEHPHTIAGLQSIWGHPSAVMHSLEAALLGQHAPGAGFGLAAYRELLLIYSIARDLAEQAGSAEQDADIDLLLPLEGAARTSPVLQLVASSVPDTMPTSLDFDLSDWAGVDPEQPRTAAGSSRY